MASNITDIAEANKKIDELEAAQETLKAEAAASADLSKLPADKIAKALENPEIWKIKRLTDLMTKAKKVEDLEKQVNDLKGQADTPDEKVAALEKRIEDLTTKNKEAVINQAITAAAMKAGVKNPSLIVKLIDRGQLEIGDDGIVTGADTQIKQLLEADPYLKGEAKATVIGSESNPDPDGQSGKPLFKASQLQDPVFYQAHAAELDKAVMNGQIEDDLTPKQ